MTENKRNLSVPMDRANTIVLFTSIPVVVAQFVLFSLLHGTGQIDLTWSFFIFVPAVLLGVTHLLIHGPAAGRDWLVLWQIRHLRPARSWKITRPTPDVM